MFKNHYVLPAHRRKGVFRKLFEFSVRYATLKGVLVIEATCTPMSLPLYFGLGANVVRRYRDYTKVELPLRRFWSKP